MKGFKDSNSNKKNNIIKPLIKNNLDEAYKRDLENSSKGRATALGGYERLRGYPEGRFFDEHTNFRGIELRYYFDSVVIDFDVIFAKGLLAEFQIAGFYEQGTVSSDLDEKFWSNFKDSYGLGIRLITGSAVTTKINASTNSVVFVTATSRNFSYQTAITLIYGV